MERIRNGVKVKYDDNEAQHGDLFRCKGCGFEVVVDFGVKFPDRNPDKFDYIRRVG
jgi:hypothetical protein